MSRVHLVILFRPFSLREQPRLCLNLEGKGAAGVRGHNGRLYRSTPRKLPAGAQA